MSPAELVPYVQRRHFVPFRIVSSAGTNYDVRQAEMVRIFPTALLFAYPNEKVPVTFLRFDFVAMATLCAWKRWRRQHRHRHRGTTKRDWVLSARQSVQ